MESNLEGYLKDSQGRLVPLSNIKEIDLERDALVRDILTGAKQLREAIKAFKVQAMGDVQAFRELSAEKYEIHLGGKKGNTTLTSFDGTLKVQVSLQETLHFDERIEAAKELIDACIMDWGADSRPEILTLVQDAFQVDQEGRINTRRILSLRKLHFDDERWQIAMNAIADSVRVSGSKYYLRIYERDANNAWCPISLDIAAL